MHSCQDSDQPTDAPGELPSREWLENAQPEVEEYERRKMAQAIHDSLSQSIAGARLLARALERQSAESEPALLAEIRALQEGLKSASEALHEL